MKQDKTRSFNVDCIEFMATVPDKFYDLAIVDPPYGIGMSSWKNESNGDGSKAKGFTKGGKNLHIKKNWDNGIPQKQYWEQLFRVSKNQIIWGGNYFTEFLPPKMGWIYWHKKGNDASNFSDGELAWTSFDKALKFVKYDWIGFGYINNSGSDKKIHPTQKPVSLYEWLLINYAKEGDKILDTHGGSQSSRIACFNLGFQMDILELDKDYFDQANKRFEQHKKQLTLF